MRSSRLGVCTVPGQMQLQRMPLVMKSSATARVSSASAAGRSSRYVTGEPNIREVVLFPMNQKAEDLMMNAPGEVTAKQLRELHIRIQN